MTKDFATDNNTQDTAVRSVVDVRFSDGRVYPYYNDMFDLQEGDVVYVDGKLSGRAGVVTYVTTRFKVSLDYYKRVLAKLDVNISGEFAKCGDMMVSGDGTAITAEQANAWFFPPREKAEEFFIGDGYIVSLDKLRDDDYIDDEVLCDAEDIFDNDDILLITIADGKGAAFVDDDKIHRIDFTISGDGVVTDLMCDCISCRLCDHCVAVCIALDAIRSAGMDIVNMTAVDKDVMLRIADFRGKNIKITV